LPLNIFSRSGYGVFIAFDRIVPYRSFTKDFLETDRRSSRIILGCEVGFRESCSSASITPCSVYV